MPEITYIREFSDEQIRETVSLPGKAGKIIASVLVSSYFGGKRVDLMDLDGLDQRGFNMANEIIRYRRTYGWSDQEFFALACFASSKHKIKV